MIEADIAVSLPLDLWEAVMGSMTWRLPDLNDDPEIRAYSERCFAAKRRIRTALIGAGVVA